MRAAQSANSPELLKASRRKVVEARESAEGSQKGAPQVKGAPPALPSLPSVGDQVWVSALDTVADVVEVRSGDKVLVATGGLKLTVRLEQLALPPKGATKARRKAERQSRTIERASNAVAEDAPSPLQTTSNTLDLRGFRRDEVADTLSQFLDRLYGANVDACWVIHGHGTGAIRDEVRKLLRLSPYVRQWRAGERGEGDNGITLAWLKDD